MIVSKDPNLGSRIESLRCAAKLHKGTLCAASHTNLGEQLTILLKGLESLHTPFQSYIELKISEPDKVGVIQIAPHVWFCEYRPAFFTVIGKPDGMFILSSEVEGGTGSKIIELPSRDLCFTLIDRLIGHVKETFPQA